MRDILWASILLGGAGYCLFRVFLSKAARQRRRRKHILRDTEAVAIPEAAPDQWVKLVGILELDPDEDPLTAPLSGRPCAHWQLRLVGAVADNSHDDIVEEQRTHPRIWLRDHTGMVASVDLEHCHVEVDIDHNEELGPLHEPSRRAERALQIRQLKQPGNHSICREGALVPGARIVVSGHCTRVPELDARRISNQAGYRNAGARVHLVGSKDQPVLVSNRPDLLGD